MNGTMGYKLQQICIRQMKMEEENKGRAYLNHHVLSEDNCVDVKIGGNNKPALVDTGATRNCMGMSLFEKLKIQGVEMEIMPSYTFCSFANGVISDAICDVKIQSLKLDEDEYQATFHVFPYLEADLILGRSFLRENKMNLYFDKDDEMESFVVKINQCVMIPGDHEALVTGRVMGWKKSSQKKFVQFRGGSFQQCKGLYAARSCNRVHEGEISVRIMNVGSEPLKLNKGNILGHARSTQSMECVQISLNSSGIHDMMDKTTPRDAIEKVVLEDIQEWVPEHDFGGSVLNEIQKELILRVIRKHKKAFVSPDGDLGYTDWIQHEIELSPDYKAAQQMPFRMSPVMKDELKKAVQQQIDLNIVEPTITGEWASPAFLVKKSRGGYRLVCDYRTLNKYTIPQFMAIPRTDDCIDAVGQIKPQYLTTLDLMMAFHQIPIKESSRDYTSFVTHFGRFRYKRMSMGLRNAARTCQLAIDMVLRGLEFKNAMWYMDDIVVMSSTFEKHLADLDEVFGRIEKAGLKLKLNKCVFAAEEVLFLGHKLGKYGIKPNPQKVEIIHGLTLPDSLRGLRRFLGLTSYYRKFIKDYARRAKSLYDLTKKDTEWIWTEERKNAFNDLKMALTHDSVLLYPSFEKEFVVTTDASLDGIGCVLSQKDEQGDMRPCAYAGRIFNSAQRNYSTLDKELAGIVFACQHWQVYLQGREFKLFTDHAPLIYILNPRSKLSSRQIRWAAEIRDFQFTVSHIKGKDNIPSDALSRLEWTGEIQDKFKGEEGYELFETFPSLIASLTLQDDRSEQKRFERTLPKKQRRVVRRFMYQVNKPVLRKKVSFSLKEDTIFEYEPVTELQVNINEMCLGMVQTRSRKNKDDTQRKRISKEIKEKRMQVDLGQEKVRMISAQSSDIFCRQMITFLEEGILPNDAKDAQRIWYLESRFIVLEDILYRIENSTGRAVDFELLIALPASMRSEIMYQYHDSGLAGHVSCKRMLSNLRREYYWPRMSKHIRDYCMSCEKCAKTKRNTRPIKPPLQIRDPAPRPWDTINLDCLERLPRTKYGNKHIAVVTDYYSRYVIAFPLKDMTAETFAREFYDKVITRVGGVRQIISDNGSNFKSAHFQKLCGHLDIKHTMGSSMHPMANGLVERMNRSILTVLRNYIASCHDDWDMYLSQICFALNTTPAYSSGHSAYVLCHGYDPIWPGSMNWSAPEEVNTVGGHFAKLIQRQQIASQLSQNILKKVQENMKARHDEYVHDPMLREGDLVWLFWNRLQSDNMKMKLAEIFSGPFYIVRYATPNTVFLKNARSGKYLEKTVTIRRLKKGLNRQMVIDRWEKEMKETTFEDPEQLEAGDLPLDSFILESKDILEGDPEDAQIGEETEGTEIQLDSEDEEVLLDKNRDFPRATTRDGKNKWVIDIVLDICQPRGSGIKYHVLYENGKREWVPRENLNKEALERFAEKEEEDEIRKVPSLRNR